MAITFSVSTEKQMDGNAFTLTTTTPEFTTDPSLLNRAVGTLFKSKLVVDSASTDIFGFKEGNTNDSHVNFTVNGETRSLNQDETVYKYYITSENTNSYTVHLITDNSTIPANNVKLGRDNVLINKSVVKASTIWFNNPSANQHSPYDPVYFIPIFGVYQNHTSGNEYYYAFGFGVDQDDTFKFTSVLQGSYTNARYNPNNKVNLTDNSVRFMAQLIDTTDPSAELATLTDRVNKIDLELIAINKRLDKLPNDIAGYVAAAASEVSKLYIAR